VRLIPWEIPTAASALSRFSQGIDRTLDLLFGNRGRPTDLGTQLVHQSGSLFVASL
jgi:hypothetical protein